MRIILSENALERYFGINTNYFGHLYHWIGGGEWVNWGRLEKYRKMKHEIDNEKHKLASEFGEKEFWDKVKYLLNHQEISRLLELFRTQYRWAYLIETFITLLVAGLLIGTLIWLINHDLIDKGSFGVMFGTVFGYLLSWSFGK